MEGIQRFLPDDAYQAAINAIGASDSNPFATITDVSTALGSYLPLAGGIMTGAIQFDTANTSIGTGGSGLEIINNAGNVYIEGAFTTIKSDDGAGKTQIIDGNGTGQKIWTFSTGSLTQSIAHSAGSLGSTCELQFSLSAGTSSVWALPVGTGTVAVNSLDNNFSANQTFGADATIVSQLKVGASGAPATGSIFQIAAGTAANAQLNLATSADKTTAASGDLWWNGTQLYFNNGSSNINLLTTSGTGDVSKVGTPVNNELAVWTGDGTLEGESNLTYDGTVLHVDATLRVGQALYEDHVTLSTSTPSVPTNVHVIYLDGSSNTVTAALPSAAANDGISYQIKCINADNTVKLARAGSDTIEGATEYIFNNNDAITLKSDGSTTWRIF